jgi:hypothetical protein
MASLRSAELAVMVGSEHASRDFAHVRSLLALLAWDTDPGIELLEAG